LDEGGASADLLVTFLRELPLVLLGIAGIAITARRDAALAGILTAWAVAAVVLLLVQHPLWPHHLIIAVPPFAIAAAALAERLPDLARRGLTRMRAGTGVVATLAATGLTVAAVSGALALRQPDSADSVVEAVDLLGSLTAAHATVISDDPFAVTQAARDTPPELVDTSNVRLHSEPLRASDVVRIIDREQVGAVLFATGRLSKLPGLQAWVAAHFRAADGLGDGRTLYRR
jgi:hypothetical protein